jgi:hypothetical protein
MIIFEFDKSKWHKFGKWESRPDGYFFFRFWIGFIAITYTSFDLASYSKSIEDGKTKFYVINR